MKIDVILITYNQEKYIKQAIEGILMQQLGKDVTKRIIVADDCSTDHTYEMIKSEFGDNATYLSRERNLGHVRNYQRAFEACDGDYVAIIEGDDYWDKKNHLQTHVDFFKAHPECVLTYSCPTIYYEEEDMLDEQVSDIDNAKYTVVSLSDEIKSNRIANLSSCVIRNAALQKLDKRIFGCSILDWPMYVNLAQIGDICRLPDSTNVYRIKQSGEYAGLNKRNQTKRDLQIISEIEAIFPQYASDYKKARRLLNTPGLLAYLIEMSRNMGRRPRKDIR